MLSYFFIHLLGIEGNPFIIRFKTKLLDIGTGNGIVLKVIHL